MGQGESVFLGFCSGLLMLSGLIGLAGTDPQSVRHSVRAEAVTAGVAKWTVNEQGEKGFEWIACQCPADCPCPK